MNKVKFFISVGDGTHRTCILERLTDQINEFAETHEILSISVSDNPATHNRFRELHAFVLYKE